MKTEGAMQANITETHSQRKPTPEEIEIVKNHIKKCKRGEMTLALLLTPLLLILLLVTGYLIKEQDWELALIPALFALSLGYLLSKPFRNQPKSKIDDQIIIHMADGNWSTVWRGGVKAGRYVEEVNGVEYAFIHKEIIPKKEMDETLHIEFEYVDVTGIVPSSLIRPHLRLITRVNKIA